MLDYKPELSLFSLPKTHGEAFIAPKNATDCSFLTVNTV